MKIIQCFLVILLLTLSASSSDAPAAEPERPNIIYIIADDLGYGELGVMGQKIIETPNLDALYDLSNDVKEANDVAADNSDIVAEMETIMVREHVPSGIDRFQFAVLGEKE